MHRARKRQAHQQCEWKRGGERIGPLEDGHHGGLTREAFSWKAISKFDSSLVGYVAPKHDPRRQPLPAQDVDPVTVNFVFQGRALVPG